MADKRKPDKSPSRRLTPPSSTSRETVTSVTASASYTEDIDRSSVTASPLERSDSVPKDFSDETESRRYESSTPPLNSVDRRDYPSLTSGTETVTTGTETSETSDVSSPTGLQETHSEGHTPRERSYSPSPAGFRKDYSSLTSGTGTSGTLTSGSSSVTRLRDTRESRSKGYVPREDRSPRSYSPMQSGSRRDYSSGTVTSSSSVTRMRDIRETHSGNYVPPGDRTPQRTSASSGDLATSSSLDYNRREVQKTSSKTFTVDEAVNTIGFGRFQIQLSLITGLCWMSDSMEMMILSILSPVLQCEWLLGKWKQALMTTIVFLGMMLSSPFWGKLSDKYGRKLSLTLAGSFLFYFGFLSSFAPTYNWLLFLRGMVGFCVGCIPQAVTLYAEFLPVNKRGKCVVLLECFWAIGACWEVLIALLMMPYYGWRWLLAVSALPLLAFTLICPWLPESARFHAASGRTDKALATLQQVSKMNGKPMPTGKLAGIPEMNQQKRGEILDLLVPKLRRTTLLLWVIWWSSAFAYYGVVLLTTELFELLSEDMCYTHQVWEKNDICQAACQPLRTEDYINLLWTTLAEFPGLLLTLVMIEKVGRKKTMAIEFLLFTLSILSLLFCIKGRIMLTVILFLSRGLISGMFQAAYVYTPEVYPTALRSVGVGTCSGMARLGAMVTPIVAQVLIKSSVLLSVVIYAFVGILAFFACLALPYETLGGDLD